MFYGGDPTADPAIAPMYKDWKFWFDKFFWMVDRENGNLLRMPFDTDTLNQPYRTMQIFDLIRGHWIEKLVDEQNKSLKK